ncbi:uncharacterized protein P174DRAFT_465354 [Aspergillus novofumigatus IBT 16806]|uniref:Major facilitator superfamily (MFS) profile domain-containing protein n=1 Tax=Aspergillus novofumigatus (strain IBT 16806) TaxID=1392255 RepID=A0A2I1CJR1_ASPN1|nr:uncharacterized protein P174DRAFT_465354 [Aspergillus novofumigatus IBT 16806]PKX97868.1 hypothetical protein P174DRAFT_465354 [Aspergillus novofumigatus IBT 16806]
MNQAGGYICTMFCQVEFLTAAVLVKNVGMSQKLAQVLGGCINMMFMFSSILPSFTLDRMQRTVMAGCSGLSLCMLMISALLSRANATTKHAFSSGAVRSFFSTCLSLG